MSTYNVEEEDEFLYGDEQKAAAEESQRPSKKPKLVSPGEIEIDDDDEEGKEDGGDSAPDTDLVESASNQRTSTDHSESESDDDIEVVIGGAREGSSKSKPSSSSTAPTMTTSSSAAGKSGARQLDHKNFKSDAARTRPPALDIDAVGEIEGKPITQMNLEEFEEKPWRKPGADITDYFNYGFDEFTWTAYCSKQDQLREDYTPQKLMAQMTQMMGIPISMGMMMPPLMMPPPPPTGPMGEDPMGGGVNYGGYGQDDIDKDRDMSGNMGNSGYMGGGRRRNYDRHDRYDRDRRNKGGDKDDRDRRGERYERYNRFNQSAMAGPGINAGQAMGNLTGSADERHGTPGSGTPGRERDLTDMSVDSMKGADNLNKAPNAPASLPSVPGQFVAPTEPRESREHREGGRRRRR